MQEEILTGCLAFTLRAEIWSLKAIPSFTSLSLISRCLLRTKPLFLTNRRPHAALSVLRKSSFAERSRPETGRCRMLWRTKSLTPGPAIWSPTAPGSTSGWTRATRCLSSGRSSRNWRQRVATPIASCTCWADAGRWRRRWSGGAVTLRWPSSCRTWMAWIRTIRSPVCLTRKALRCFTSSRPLSAKVTYLLLASFKSKWMGCWEVNAFRKSFHIRSWKHDIY